MVPRERLLLWVAVLGLPLATLAGAVAEARPATVGLLGALVAVVLGDALLSRRRVAGLALEGPPVLRLVEGREGRLELILRDGVGSTATVRLALALPAALTSPEPLLEVRPPGDRAARLWWPLQGLRRGRFPVERCRLERRSRLGFWDLRAEARLGVQVRVYPALLAERRALAGQFLRRGGLGAHLQRRLGKGREFEKLREYLPGDGLDDVHWKASARRGHLVSKEYQVERTQEVYAVLDVSRLSARPSGDRAALECTLRAAMVLALATRQYRDRFGLVVFADRVRAFLPARAGQAQFNACRETLFAEVSRPVSPDFTEVATFVRLRLRRRALLVFLTDLDDPALAEDFVRAVELIGRQHLVVAAMLRPEGAEPLFERTAASRDEVVERLAGHLAWHRLHELDRVLHHRGVHLAVLERDTLAADVVSRYVAVKERQQL